AHARREPPRDRRTPLSDRGGDRRRERPSPGAARVSRCGRRGYARSALRSAPCLTRDAAPLTSEVSLVSSSVDRNGEALALVLARSETDLVFRNKLLTEPHRAIYEAF